MYCKYLKINPHNLPHMRSEHLHADTTFSHAQYVHQLMYVAHPDMQCISLHLLTFVKTHFISKQIINYYCTTLTFNGTSVDILLRRCEVDR